MLKIEFGTLILPYSLYRSTTYVTPTLSYGGEVWRGCLLAVYLCILVGVIYSIKHSITIE